MYVIPSQVGGVAPHIPVGLESSPPQALVISLPISPNPVLQTYIAMVPKSWGAKLSSLKKTCPLTGAGRSEQVIAED